MLRPLRNCGSCLSTGNAPAILDRHALAPSKEGAKRRPKVLETDPVSLPNQKMRCLTKENGPQERFWPACSSRNRIAGPFYVARPPMQNEMLLPAPQESLRPYRQAAARALRPSESNNMRSRSRSGSVGLPAKCPAPSLCTDTAANLMRRWRGVAEQIIRVLGADCSGRINRRNRIAHPVVQRNPGSRCVASRILVAERPVRSHQAIQICLTDSSRSST